MDGGSQQSTADNVISFDSAQTAEIELKRRLEQLHALLDIGRSMGSQLELRELIGVISDCLREVIHCDAFWMSLIDSESGQLRVYALDPKFNKDALAYEGRLVPLEDTLAEKAIKSLQTLLFTRDELRDDLRIRIENAKTRVNRQLELLASSRERLESTVSEADAAVELLRKRSNSQ